MTILGQILRYFVTLSPKINLIVRMTFVGYCVIRVASSTAC